ncbi:MAG: sensor histidine kinase [Anaerolineaceae bacterium]|nr:sensor histidine kinase [Anaerolineaceae bacterium]
MKELSLHILDIIENSLSARADTISIQILEDGNQDIFEISIEDNGMGMDAKTVEKVIDPFTTSRSTRKVGLGIPLFKASAEACNGDFQITSKKGIGTKIKVSFQNSHIDRMPLGEIGDTIHSLLITSPEITWIFSYSKNNSEFSFNSSEINKHLGEVSITDPLVIRFLREFISDGINSLC